MLAFDFVFVKYFPDGDESEAVDFSVLVHVKGNKVIINL